MHTYGDFVRFCQHSLNKHTGGPEALISLLRGYRSGWRIVDLLGKLQERAGKEVKENSRKGLPKEELFIIPDYEWRFYCSLLKKVLSHSL